MDTLYYSNHCKHSQRVIQFLVKGNLAEKLNFICIDRRAVDPLNNQLHIILENGQKVPMPPNIQRVPALMLIRKNYQVIVGEDIIKHFHPMIEKQMNTVPDYQGEPLGVGDGLMNSNRGVNIVSEPYTFYSLTPDELSAKGTGGRRQMYNYVSANHEILTIHTPPDNYQPDKVSSNVTLDTLQQKRIDEVQPANQGYPFVPKL